MKKSLSTVLTGLMLVASSAGYAENTITFNGEVVDATCEPAVVNGDYTVTLDQVLLTSLTSVGKYDAISAPFSIQLINCPPTATTVGITLNSNTYDAVTGNLTDVAGYGNDSLQIQIMDGLTPTDQIEIGSATAASTVAIDSNRAASIPMIAYYYVKDLAGLRTGTISTTAVYAIRTN